LMDNCEVYRGLRDVASLFQAIGDAGKASYYKAAADANYNGILGMWMNGKWAVYKDYYGALAAPHMNVWYADATAQLFPVLYQVIPGSDSRAQQAYAAFNAAWPSWTNLSFSSQDQFPWVMIADAAALMGDKARANAYIDTIQQKYVSKGFPWTWYNMEAGWFMRLNAYMLGRRPF
jgi:GH15 family glucan-1,4-alpha-glucosidase